MAPARIIAAYLEWHFGRALREIFEWYNNMAWFGYHFFSIPLLLKTLMRPIYRIHEAARPGTGINIQLFFENLTVNMIARVAGLFLRIFLILCGGMYQLILLIITPIFFVVWFALPVIPILLVFIGFQMAF